MFEKYILDFFKVGFFNQTVNAFLALFSTDFYRNRFSEFTFNYFLRKF